MLSLNTSQPKSALNINPLKKAQTFNKMINEASSSSSTTEEETMVVGDLVEFMQRLSLAPDEERPGMLNEISPIISSVAARNANFKKNLAEANLNLIFDCFNSKGQDDLDIASDVLLKISEYIDGDLLVKKYEACFKRGLEHPNPSVREAHLKLLRKSMRSAKGFDEVLANNVLLTLATRCTKDADLSVAKESMAFLGSLSSLDQANAEMPLLRDPVLPLVNELTKDTSEIVRLRIYDVLVNVAKKSENHLGRVAKHHFLQSLFDEVKKDDFLLQLNALELLTELAQVRQGLDYLESSHVLRDLEKSIDSFSSGATASFLIPGLVKFFGVVANQHRQDCLVLYPKFKSLLSSMLMGNDAPERLVAIETLAHICRNPRKKILFSDKDSYGELAQLFTGQLNTLIRSGGTEGRSKGLGILADICQVHKQDGGALREEELIINQRLLEMFDEKPLALVTQYASVPIVEISGMAYQLLLSLSDQEWALRKFQNQPGFLEFLLDRNTVMDKQILEVKFDTIRKMSEGVAAEQIFSEDSMKRMHEYVKEGPFYSPCSVQVAFDEM